MNSPLIPFPAVSRQFAPKVRNDEAAVQAGYTPEWSNGQSEG